MAKAVYTEGLVRGQYVNFLKISRQIHGKKQPETQGGLGRRGVGGDTPVFWKGVTCLGRLTIGEGVWHGDPMSSQLLECPKLVDAV